MKYVNMQYDYVSQKEKGYKHNLNKRQLKYAEVIIQCLWLIER